MKWEIWDQRLKQVCEHLQFKWRGDLLLKIKIKNKTERLFIYYPAFIDEGGISLSTKFPVTTTSHIQMDNFILIIYVLWTAIDLLWFALCWNLNMNFFSRLSNLISISLFFFSAWPLFEGKKRVLTINVCSFCIVGPKLFGYGLDGRSQLIMLEEHW